MLTRSFHRKVVPASMGRGQAHRENMQKITCKPIPVLLKQLKTITLHCPSPPETAKINVKSSGQLATVLTEWGENWFTEV